MSDEHPEPFDLPEWGTAGAPPEPIAHESDESPEPEPLEDLDVLLDVEQELMHATTGLPASHRVRSLIGLVAAEGSASVSDDVSLQAATGAARSAALDRLASEAGTIGATAVVGIRLAVTVRLNEVAVIAYGTAMDATPR